jgi:hypothetical protein
MFREQLLHYISLPTSGKQPELILDTASSYEFTMTAMFVSDTWYALIEDPDEGRISDINAIIQKEFDADVLGWCVLKDHQEESGAKTLPFSEGEANYDVITHDVGGHLCWLLKLMPRVGGRLTLIA